MTCCLVLKHGRIDPKGTPVQRHQRGRTAGTALTAVEDSRVRIRSQPYNSGGEFQFTEARQVGIHDVQDLLHCESDFSVYELEVIGMTEALHVVARIV